MKRILTTLILGLLLSSTINAQILTPAKWSYKMSKEHPKQGDILELIFTVKLDATWHLYGNKQNYDLGPLPAVFEFEPNCGYRLLGDVEALGIKKKYDDIFDVDVNYFEDSAEFRQKIKILSKNAVIKGYYEYQVCTTVDGMCILGDDDFEFNIITTN